jgi:anti-sigma factor RsiW
MVDCPRDDIRDLLPDLVHDQLEPEARARVERHVAECDECAAELELLRSLRATVFATPEVDADRIAANVRRAMTQSGRGVAGDDRVVPIREARERSSKSASAIVGGRSSDASNARPARRSLPQSWRIAAGIALVAAGAGGYALTRGGPRSFARSAERPAMAEAQAPSRAPAASALEAGSGSPMRAAKSTSDVAGAADSILDATAVVPAPLILGDAVNELSESDMQALLQSVDDLQALPDLEPHQLPVLATVVEGAL